MHMSEAVKYGETFAILNDDNEVIPCGEQKWAMWWYMQGGMRRSRIRRDYINGRLIETSFTARSRSLDGPHLFWLVSLSALPPAPDRPPRGLVATIAAQLMPIGTPRYSVLKDALRASPPFEWAAFFGTLEKALTIHAQIKNALRAKERLTEKMPDKTQELLLELQFWCSQQWGRQTQVAKVVGTTPQTVNDWLTGRKKMTGEQALRVQELIARKVRSGSDARRGKT
jgi:DNA-binding transcriptional regulator YiaG